MKTALKTKIKNILCATLITLSLLLSSNFGLALGAVNLFKNRASAEYAPTEKAKYDFTTTSGWNTHTNAPSTSELYTAFNKSRISADLYDPNSILAFKPDVKYNKDVLQTGDGIEKDADVDDYAMTLQATNAPKSVVVTRTDDNGNVVYQKDADGNFLLEPEIYNEDDIKDPATGLVPEIYEIIEGTKTYKKRIEVLDSEGSKVYKTDKKGNYIYEPKVYDDNSDNDGDTNLFVERVDYPGTFNKKIHYKDTVDSYYGYRSSSTITLNSNSWFVFSFWVWTTENTTASFVLSSGENYTQIVNIECTNAKWQKYYIFIESASDNSTSVNAYFYYGSKERILPQESELESATGAVFIDNFLVQNISQTDFNLKKITGEEFPSIEEDDQYLANYVIASQDSLLRFTDTGAIASLNGDFQQEEISLYSLMYGETDYNESEANSFAWSRYVSRYTDDNGDEERSENQLADLRRTYKNENLFKYEIVNEPSEFKVDDLEEDGTPKTDDNGETLKKDGPSTFTSENKALKITNNSEAYALGFVSAPIELQQLQYYRLSLFVKGATKDDKVIVKLISSIKTASSGDKGVFQVKSQSMSAYTDSSDFTNNWTEISFYIQSNCYYDTTMQLVLLADTESTVYFDNIRFESITSENYRNQSSSKRFDLSPSSTTYSSRIENGFFNSITKEKADPSKFEMPYTPYNWTKLDDNSESVVSGIVSTKSAWYNNNIYKDKDGNETSVKQKLGGASAPLSYYKDTGIQMPETNVLAIYSPAYADMDEDAKKDLDEEDFKGHYYGYKSSQFSLSSNSVYKVSFEVFISEESKAKFDGTLFANLIYADKHVGEYSVDISDGSDLVNGWVTFTFVVRTGSSSRTLSLELGVKDAVGTVFFQKVNYVQLTELENKEDKDNKITVDDQYADLFKDNSSAQLQEQNRMKFIDFDGDTTSMRSANKVENKDYYASLAYELKKSDDDKVEPNQGEVGIVDTSANLVLSDTETIEASALDNKANSNSDFAMIIYNGENLATNVVPNTSSTLSASSYYEISLWVKTINVAESNGLRINMSAVGESFENINTSAVTENNGYKKYTILVTTGSSSISSLRIEFSLGSEQAPVSGIALISGLNIKKIDSEEDYKALVEAVDEEDTTTRVRDFSTGQTSNEETDDVDNMTLATFFLVFSSIMLVGAIVFAVIAVYVKRSPKHAKVKSGDNSDNSPKEGFV